MLLRMTEMWRNNMEHAGEVEKLWSNSIPMWNLHRQVYALMAAWMDVGPRMSAYHAIASIPWNKAYERYSAMLADTKEEDAKGFGRPGAFDTWRSIANEELISNLRSQDFLVAQRELLRAALDLCTRQQEMADSVGKLFGVPTHRDFDELTRQITELRRELRASLRAQRHAAERAAALPDTQARDEP
ncbi:poly(R)-hydroxyalkanoic acid synthase subunit PhaE [Sinorhizobium meliloti]|uniref:poly(R)-hydroxyalkanoic acid synthase subunit PhaE n=1 Tax=Rhizobium meliloti TaxID=382 RepID=UPI0004146B80|nr:poly(R)-hydroxyalkanoic acid synthase subunit PhaE [Sinorhizobium meliloti]